MRRIDLEWQARWEMLKAMVERRRTEHEYFDNIYRAMCTLEEAQKPCLSRAIKEYRSPMTGEPRQVYVMVDGELELVPPVPLKYENRKELPE